MNITPIYIIEDQIHSIISNSWFSRPYIKYSWLRHATTVKWVNAFSREYPVKLTVTITLDIHD